MSARALVGPRTLIDAVLPHSGIARAVILSVVGSVFIAAAAQVAIPLPFTPVPITGQTLAVLLVGAAFGARVAAVTVLVYIAGGVAGLPVWSPGASFGIARLLGPTGGYLVGFVAAAWLVGWLAERGWNRDATMTAAAMVLGNVVIYLVGLAGLARFVAPEGLLAAGLLPFLIGDALKIAIATAILPWAWRLADGRGGHRVRR